MKRFFQAAQLAVAADAARSTAVRSFRVVSSVAATAVPLTVTEAEVHWYEAHGIGKRWIKIKRYAKSR
jgi:CO/xanthine dehydrogenase FAD-binding subunit